MGENQTSEIELPTYFKFLNGRPRVYVSAVTVPSMSSGYVNDGMTHVIIKTIKKGIYNIMVTAIRKDPAAIKYSEEEEIAEFLITNK